MFQEIVYTRCRQGVDILHQGQPDTKDGFKVYNCNPSVYEGPDATRSRLQYLESVIGAKQSYSDPEFMDDAYLYYTPDEGENLLVCFHPIRFDAHVQADYSKRRGNYINQILIGDYTDFYPYETFGNAEVWTAKEKGEEYYYSAVPEKNEGRSDIGKLRGNYSLAQIQAFISAGRQDALAKAVSFLIEQYRLAPEKRKYLVIQDDSSENIELWIAAIESAFSPRMAAGLSFATRMDRFQETNRYTVNQDGAYQTLINLQDPKQFLRFKAMIVGVNKQAGPASVRVMPTLPYVVLDGTAKKALFEADSSNPYYSFITQLDDEQVYFCREFVQTFDIFQPSGDICDLYDAYKTLYGDNSPSAKALECALHSFERFGAHKTNAFGRIYSVANKTAKSRLNSDPASVVSIMNWIVKVSGLAGDDGAYERLVRMICGNFSEALYKRTGNASEIWSSLRTSTFAEEVARFITDERVWNSFSASIREFSPEEAHALFLVLFDCIKLRQFADSELLIKVVASCSAVYSKYAREDLLSQMVQKLSEQKGSTGIEMLLDIAGAAERVTGDFIVNYLIQNEKSIFISEKNMWDFCRRLRFAELGSKVPSVIQQYVGRLNSPMELERFAKSAAIATDIRETDRHVLYIAIDSLLSLNPKTTTSLAVFLQRQAQKEHISLPASAHLGALAAISDRRRTTGIRNTLEPFAVQGVPCNSDVAFAKQLAAALARERMEKEDEEYICFFLLRGPGVYFTEYLCQIIALAEKQLDRWKTIICYCDRLKDDNMRNTAYSDLIDALISCQPSLRSIKKLGAVLTESKVFFSEACVIYERQIQNTTPKKRFRFPFR